MNPEVSSVSCLLRGRERERIYICSTYINVSLFLSSFAAKDKGEKKLFGFAFTPLMRDDGTTLSDDIHELYVYKVQSLTAL